jgi:hypothetical protein
MADELRREELEQLRKELAGKVSASPEPAYQQSSGLSRQEMQEMQDELGFSHEYDPFADEPSAPRLPAGSHNQYQAPELGPSANVPSPRKPAPVQLPVPTIPPTNYPHHATPPDTPVQSEIPNNAPHLENLEDIVKKNKLIEYKLIEKYKLIGKEKIYKINQYDSSFFGDSE